jgi:hypothetical protein
MNKQTKFEGRTNFTVSPRPLNSLLSIWKKICNGCPYPGDIFTVKIGLQVYEKIFLHKKSVLLPVAYSIFFFPLARLEFFTFFIIFLKISLSFLLCVRFQTFYQRPQRPRWPLLSGPLCPRLAPRLPPRALPRPGPPPLWVGFWCPDPRPRWDGGSWPESQSGGGGGQGLGGEVGGCPVAATFFLAGAGAGTTTEYIYW